MRAHEPFTVGWKGEPGACAVIASWLRSAHVLQLPAGSGHAAGASRTAVVAR